MCFLFLAFHTEFWVRRARRLVGNHSGKTGRLTNLLLERIEKKVRFVMAMRASPDSTCLLVFESTSLATVRWWSFSEAMTQTSSPGPWMAKRQSWISCFLIRQFNFTVCEFFLGDVLYMIVVTIWVWSFELVFSCICFEDLRNGWRLSEWWCRASTWWTRQLLWLSCQRRSEPTEVEWMAWMDIESQGGRLVSNQRSPGSAGDEGEICLPGGI